MSTAIAPAPSTAAPQRDPGHGGVTFTRVVNSEWIKFRTLRSSWLVLLSAVTAMILIGLLIGYNTGKHFAHLAPEDAAPSGVLQGYFLGQLLVGVLGVLFVTGEYTTGMIRSTLAAVPRRLPVLLAKAIVFLVVTLLAMVVASVVAFLAAQLFLKHYGHGYSLGDQGVLRVVLGTGLYLALIGLLGGGIGWIVRSTPGGIATLVGLLLVIPVIFQVLPGKWAVDVAKYLPSEAGGSFVASVRTPDTPLAPATGLLALVVWVVASLVVAAVLLKRRDG